MKQIYSYFKTMAAAAFTLLAATACNESYEYVPDNETAGKTGQVFFGQDLPAVQELDIDATEFSITMTRANTQGEITVPLTSTQPEPAIYNVPSSVTFADGNTQATITITVDPKNLVYDDFRTLSISIDSTYNTPYGTSTYTMQVGVPAPWTEWCSTEEEFLAQGGQGAWPLGSEGTGTYTFTQLLQGSVEKVPVEFRQHKLNGDCQFRFLGLDVPTGFPAWEQLVLEAKWMDDQGVYMLRLPKTTTGYIMPNFPGDPLFVMDQLSYMEANGTEVPWDQWAQLRPDLLSWYNPETGLFQISLFYAISAGYFGNGIETLQMNGFYIPDLSIEAQYKGIYTSEAGKVSAIGTATLGKDLTEARAIVMPQGMEIQPIIETIMSQDAPSEDFPWVALTQSGDFSANFDPQALDSEKLQLLVFGINEGKVTASTTAKFEYYAGEKPWKSLGTGLYRDDIVITLFENMEAAVYEVEIMEHKDKPGLYRLMNVYNENVHPFGAALTGIGATMAPEGSYLEINATDPKGVYIATQSLQCTVDNQLGDMSYCTYPYFAISQGGLTMEQAKENGFLGEVMDGVIAFPHFLGPDNLEFQGVLMCASNDVLYAATTTGVAVLLPDAPAFEQNMARAKAKKTMRLIRKDAARVKFNNKNLHINPLVHLHTNSDLSL